jgi:triacylglycerol esterase/lipase EstA (alpha/beta hydrolase family)
MEKTIRRKVVIMKLEGTPLVILHGLMGGLSNFDAVASYFSDKGYKIVIGFTYIHSKYFKTNVKSLNTSRTLSLLKV